MADQGIGHDSHDPALIASLFDGDLPEAELATAQLRVATCPSCAALHADLLALSQATRAQPTPDRPRDFRLSPADAARLRAEPVAPDARLTGVMTDRSGAAAHSTHDTTLVASLTDHSVPEAERAAAEGLVAACSDCAILHADLVALVAATRSMPTPPRPIDYTLTRGHAAKLRPNPWRRLVAVVGSAHDGLTRPLAIGFTALGLVGVLVASAPTLIPAGAGFGGGATSSQGGETQPIVNAAPAPGGGDTSGNAAAGAALVPPSGAAPDRAAENLTPVFGADIPPKAAASGGTLADGFGTSEAGGPIETQAPDVASSIELSQTDAPSGANVLLVVSLAFVFVGLGLFLLRWGARRLTDG